MTHREKAVATEIRRIARDELELEWNGSDDEDLAGRLDSLALLSLVVAVEDHFRVRIEERETVSARTLADLSCLVAAKLAPGAHAEVES